MSVAAYYLIPLIEGDHCDKSKIHYVIADEIPEHANRTSSESSLHTFYQLAKN